MSDVVDALRGASRLGGLDCVGEYGAPWGSPVVVVQRDARAMAAVLAEAALRPTLIYADPPFAAERDFYVGARSDERLAYSDRWPSFDAYLAFMDGVIEAAHDALADDGSLLLHCDHRASPYLAIACDARFGKGDRERRGAAGFRNELIWSYGLGGSSPTCYPKKHDTILWYSKGAEWTFDPPMVPAKSARMAGQLKKAPDVLDIPSLNNMAKERCGYPTQKPLELLSLLVNAHTRPGELVVDPFSGSGSTAVAAAGRGRPALVFDIGHEAIGATVARCEAAGARVRVFAEEAPQTLALWRD